MVNNNSVHLRMDEDFRRKLQAAARKENKTINDYVIDVLKNHIAEEPKVLKLIDGYYVDANNNRWSEKKYSAELIDIVSESLENCHNCVDCEDCWNCSGCVDCYACGDCVDCISCRNCDFWKDGKNLEKMNFKKFVRIMKNEDNGYLRAHMETLAEFKNEIMRHYDKNRTCVYPCENADLKSYVEIFDIYAGRVTTPEEYWRRYCQEEYKTKEEYIDELVQSDVITIGKTGFIFWK
ncbi:MAG: hypothetical protein ACOX7J_01705 [Bacillota bacterium]